MDATEMGRRLGIERESVYRLEREAISRCNPRKLYAYAAALGVEPEDLWRPPGQPSLDAMTAHAPEELKRMAAEIVSTLLKKQ